MSIRIDKAFGMLMETLTRMQNGYEVAQARTREGEITMARYKPKPSPREQSSLF